MSERDAHATAIGERLREIDRLMPLASYREAYVLMVEKTSLVREWRADGLYLRLIPGSAPTAPGDHHGP